MTAGNEPERAELWEWAVTRDGRDNPVGVSRTCHGALTADRS
jgi:hypothetical protein